MEDMAAWVVQLQAGEEAAFDEIYAAYRKQAVRTAALISGDAHLAEDIAQDAFVICYEHIGKLKDPNRFRAWFFRILTRCAWQTMKRRGKTTDLDETAQDLLHSAPDSYPSHRRAEYEKLYCALDQLGTKQKTTVILHYFSRLSIREIAHATSAPEATVKTRLFAARRRLQKTLNQKGETGR